MRKCVANAAVWHIFKEFPTVLHQRKTISRKRTILRFGEKTDIIEKVEQMKGLTKASMARDIKISESSLIPMFFSFLISWTRQILLASVIPFAN